MSGTRAPLVLVAVLLAGCAPSGEEAEFLARRDVLQRENQGIRALITAAEHGSLVPADRLLVGVDEKVVRELLRSQLPLDLPLGDQFVVRVSDATVLLRDNVGRFQLAGEIHRPATPDRRTAVNLTGGLAAVGIDPGSGMLTLSIALDHVELKEAGLLEKVLGPGGKKFLAENARGMLQQALPPLQVPVAFTQDLNLPGFHDGPVQLDSAVVPLRLSIERVLAAEGKLWVTLHGEIGRVSGAASDAGLDVELLPKRPGTTSDRAGGLPAQAAPERSRGKKLRGRS